jgi:hypothetical protein
VLNYCQREVDYIYVIIFIALSILIYNLISYYLIKHKQKVVLKSNNVYLSKHKKNFVSSYINKIESKLFNLGYPYKLSTKKYIVFKYVLPIVIFIIGVLNYKSIKISLILFLISFFTPNYLLYSYTKDENNILINEIKNITNSIVLSLSAYGTLEYALSTARATLTHTRFILAWDKFIYEYKMYGYNIKQASINLEKKFKSYELSLFLSTLIQGDAEGNLLENLEKFCNTLELNYFKYLKKKSAERLMYVTLGTVLSLVNIVLVVMYPIFKQVIDNLQIIFS